ncbi:MAG: ABC transporter ATP-binding protein [Erysipelotrichaceae bacterium]|nr:ABC transporter ATP-binding protein [Erysipelotrichaceae bacterium]
MNNNYACTIEDLRVIYDGFKLMIHHYEIPKGFVTGLVGKNGAGKSTLIRSLLGIISRNTGNIEILGMNFADHTLEIKNRIGYVNDSFVFPPDANAQMMGRQIGQFYDQFDQAYYQQLLKKYNIDLRQKFKHFSKGMCAKFSIIFSMAHHADFLVLDEPTANLDPVSRREVLDLLYDMMQDEEKTILFSTHITSDLDQIADYVTLIDNGKIEFTLSKDELQNKHQIVYIEGEIPQEMKSTLKGIRKTKNGYTALCTQSDQFSNTENIKFNKASIEDLMVYWEINHD